jgi:sulfoxide reductase heme-binding subunit YedZ
VEGAPIAAGGERPRRSSPSSREAPRARRRAPLAWLEPAALALAVVPAAKLGLDAFTGGLGANPIAEGMNRLGFWTLTFLALSLAPTPLHDLAGLTWPVRLRRLLGLTAFAYGAAHFLWYLVIDQFFDWATIAKDVTKRRFITVGFAALLLLVPLAVTSTNAWVRRLGYARWKRLHRLVYAAAGLAVIHFLWRVKADLRKPLLFAAVVGALLLARAGVWGWRRIARTGR